MTKPAMIGRRAIAIAATVSLASTSRDAVAAAQQQATLRGPPVELQEPFSGVVRIREIADGRILVLDTTDARVVVADFRSGKVTDVGRRGDGPGEYRRLNGMYPLGGDSTLLEDRRGRRWILLDGTRIAATINSSPDGKLIGFQGADSLGRVLELQPFSFRRSPGVPYTPMRISADSLAVIVRHRSPSQPRSGGAATLRLTRTQDTVARIRGMAAGQTIAWRPIVNGGTPVRWLLESPLASEQQAFLFADGWIALALTDPYRVTWISPDNRRTTVTLLVDSDIRLNDQVKRALVARRWPNVKPSFTDDELPPWPTKLPPFLNDALTGTPDGRLAIRRTFDPGQRVTFYDLVDRTGLPVRRLALAAHERIVGFGRRTVYVIAKDPDDVETVRRYPWP
jgi:hypothetical protein